jgi:cell division protein FtsQ
VNTRSILRKVIFISVTLAVCSGLLVLLVAAIGKKNREHCTDYVVNLKDAKDNIFISEKDVMKLMNETTHGKIKGEPITEFNLTNLEQKLKGNPWIKDANLYFDNKDVLHIAVKEKEPIARIFTTKGRSFYIDSSGDQMPLSDLQSARVPLFTNFPDLSDRQAGKNVLNTNDSALLSDVKKTSLFILNDPFWMAQVEQVDIDEDDGFEMIPTVGDHIVKLGNGDDIDKKFHRLLVFYQQVLGKAGFNKYNVVDVRFNGQVIGSKTKTTKIDPLQVKRNVEKLLEAASQMQRDTLASLPVITDKTISRDKEPKSKTLVQQQTSSNPLKTTTTKPKLIEKKTEEQKPKAVIPAKSY